MTFLWVAVAVLSILVAISLLALVDQYRTLELIRAKLNLEDSPEPISIPRDRPVTPSAVGLPAELDGRQHLVVLFLSTSCTTCRSIAQGIRTKPSSAIWVVLQQAHTAEQGVEWLRNADISTDQAVIDLDGRIAAALGINAIPSAVLYRRGEALLAQTIPSFRQLVPLLSTRTMPTSLKLRMEGSTKT